MRTHLFAVSALCIGAAHANQRRDIVSEVDTDYDFVVVGGGQSGLVLGGRLSEDANHTVLVIESGGNGDDFRTRIDTPAFAYFNSLWETPLNWDFRTIPQANAKGREMHWPRGKVLGGSSAINGLYLNRPGKIDIDTWNELLGDMDGADNWTWETMLAGMKKSETFSPPRDAMAAQGAVAYNAGSRGTSGPISASYPGFSVSFNSEWITGLANMDVSPSPDAYGGVNSGAYISSSCMNPNTWTRSYSRTGYLDAMSPRSNYHVLPNAHVTRIIFDDESGDDDLNASAVEFSTDGGATTRTVRVNKEVILAGGTVGSPAVLLHSGIGPRSVLNAAGVGVVRELPGVGNNLQDHLLSTIYFDTTEKTPGAIWSDLSDGTRTDRSFLSFINDAVAYISAPRLFGSGYSAFQSSATSASYTPVSGEETVQAGYRAIAGATASIMLPSELGQVELLLVTSTLDGKVGITAALQHPFSHGAITIGSSNPFDSPLINPNYLTHPADVAVLREGLKMARQLGNTSPFSDTLTGESSPGSTVQSDADWEDWLRGNSDTEYHPSSTCAMLPLEQGGVVDANLKVYGLANVRVADASVPPVSFSAHLMGSTYGVAEIAAEIIRNSHNVPVAAKSVTKPQDIGQKTETEDDDDADETANSSPAQTSAAANNDDTSHNSAISFRPAALSTAMVFLASVMIIM